MKPRKQGHLKMSGLGEQQNGNAARSLKSLRESFMLLKAFVDRDMKGAAKGPGSDPQCLTS